MPGLKNQIRILRIILILVRWSSKPNDESCSRAVELAPYRGFVGIRGSIWLCLVYLNIYCGLLRSMLGSVRSILGLRMMRQNVKLAIYIPALHSRLRNVIDTSNKPTDALPCRVLESLFLFDCLFLACSRNFHIYALVSASIHIAGLLPRRSLPNFVHLSVDHQRTRLYRLTLVKFEIISMRRPQKLLFPSYLASSPLPKALAVLDRAGPGQILHRTKKEKRAFHISGPFILLTAGRPDSLFFFFAMDGVRSLFQFRRPFFVPSD